MGRFKGLRGAVGRALLACARVLAFLVILDCCLFLLFDALPEATLGQVGIMALDADLLKEMRDRLGVSGAWYERLTTFWGNLLRGDFGQSLIGGYPINSLLRERFQASFPLWLSAALMVLPVPVVASLFSARPSGNDPSWRRIAVLAARLGIAPQFLVLLILFGCWTVFLADTLTDMGVGASARWGLAILGTTLMPASIAFLASVDAVTTCMRSPYLKTYQMLGLSDWQIRTRILRNVLGALRPLLARLILLTLTGAVFAELMFRIDGIGALFVSALRTSDLNVMRVLVLLTGVIVLGVSEWERAAS